MDLRKIDALIAERVMGWTLSSDPHGCGPAWNTGKGCYVLVEHCRPSTDGNDMLAVIERMATLGYRISVESAVNDSRSYDYSAGFSTTTWPQHSFLYREWNKSLPLAVSLAALRMFLTPEEFAEVSQ